MVMLRSGQGGHRGYEYCQRADDNPDVGTRIMCRCRVI